MINKKNKTYFFVVISFVCIVFIVGFHILDGRNITLFDPIIEYIKQYHIKDVVNIVAILSGISAILVGVASIRISNLGAVKEYFQQGDNKEYTTARHNLVLIYIFLQLIAGQVILEDYVSVGTGSTILPGVKLEEGVAVGAMSFVKHTLEGWKIYVGAPCRYVKDRNQNMKQLRAALQNSDAYEESR